MFVAIVVCILCKILMRLMQLIFNQGVCFLLEATLESNLQIFLMRWMGSMYLCRTEILDQNQTTIFVRGFLNK